MNRQRRGLILASGDIIGTGHIHEWMEGWQKNEPSYRWTESQQWPDDIPMRACRICGPENGKGWMSL